MKIFLIFFLMFFSVVSYACEPWHDYPDIQLDDDLDLEDDELYNLENYGHSLNQNQLLTAYRKPESGEDTYVYMQKAMKAYDHSEYKKCLAYLKKYEDTFSDINLQLTLSERVLVLSYKAYAKKALRKYDSAKDHFSHLIELLKQGDYERESLFYAYWQHASCYYGLGEKEKCQDRIKKLVNMDIGPNVDYLKKNNYKLVHQPCFHEHGAIKKDKIIISEIIATVIGQEIVNANGHFYPDFCTCLVNEDVTFCSDCCARIAGYGAIACAFIPGRTLQAIALWALVEFQIECDRCCNDGLGHVNCARKLKQILTRALDQSKLDELW
jgi:tetratricopeptide (TPR) repeat protein